MSFIHNDKNLLNELIRLAQEQRLTPKTPQQLKLEEDLRGGTPQEIKALQDMARKLVTNLQSQLNAPKFTAERDNADLRMQAKDLNSLLAFLSLNGIALSNLKLALPNLGNQAAITGTGEGNPELTKLSPEQQKLYMTYPYEAPRYFVYKDGLIAYLRDLKSKNIPLLTAMADKLIEQANEELGLKMTKEVPKEEIKLDPEMVVDELPTPFSAENPTARGPFQIKIKDLASFNTKSSFVDNILAKVNYSKDNQPVALDSMDKGTLCSFIGALHDRASQYFELREEPRFKQYLDAVTRISSMYACPVRGAADGDGNVKPVSYRTQNGGLSGEAMSALATSLPLDPEEMDLNRIDAFARAYAKYTKDNQRAQIAIQGVASIKARYNGMALQNLTRYSLKDVSEAIHRNTGGKETSPAPYFESLKQILMATENILSTLSSMNKNSAGAGPVDQFRADIAEQMTFFSKNLASINRWQQDMMAEYNNLNQRNK